MLALGLRAAGVTARRTAAPSGARLLSAASGGKHHAVERELLDREQLRRQHNTLSAQDADDVPFAESIDDYFASLECNDNEKKLITDFKGAVEKADIEGADQIANDYALLLAATREKLRLTVEWNDTAKLTEKERVKATASRVGLDVPKELA
ncbi:Hypothetical Protein FCC1311_041882 [Hondaea fermentalgiana]|uniref:Uncharacterized protein n=1 Tax=Hondaea fermentalgiana TaxID=2315210 RepID=A0A2R5GBK6_9STRA|nr:Hypothetical Protein FCC1311_041882 [Hondaea fermentalgiana]|eukprot:GBG27965.1 Hypothetical Protein FCC1311_041882 [Hondaea fermentalgiana]